MLRIRQILRRVFRKGAGGQKKQDNPPAAPSVPAAPSANITSEDSTTTENKDVQQKQTSDGFPSTANHQLPPASQSLWDQAYNSLAKKMPDLVKEYDELLAKEEQVANSVLKETTPLQLPALHGPDTRSDRSPRQVQLNTVIQNGLQRMDDNKATYNIGGHEFDLSDQITQVSNLLLWGKEWIGSAVKASPEASMVWCGVCLILPLLTNPATAAEANRDGFAYVTSRMRYYVALEPLLRRLGQNASVDEALISAANDHIVDLYQAILEFQLSSILRFYQSRFRTYLHDIVPSRDWKQTQLDIKTRERTVNSDLGQINDLAARQELEHLNKTSEDTRATMENCLSIATEHLAVSKVQLAAQLAAEDDAKREKLLAKQQKCLQLFCLTQNGNGATYDWYKDRVEFRVEGTCGWFLQHKSFQKWLLQESGPLLVSADPGCGKSVLAKYMIDHGLAKQSATICYFFFKDQDQNSIRQALCALLHQLFRQKSALLPHAMQLYDDMGAALAQSETSLWTILRNAVRDSQAGPVIFVIDALDECDESQLSSLIRNLRDIFCGQQRANAKFKVLMTSRPYEHVVSEFHSLQAAFQHIHIPGEEEFETISQEINSVIHYRVEQLAEKHRLLDKLKSSLVNKLLAIDHRTYLWIYLVFDHLDKGFKKTDTGIDAAIQTLPKTVNQAYEQILNRSRDEETAKTVKKVLSIILAAGRPLTLSEMNMAMNLNDEGRGRSIDDLDLEQDVDFKSRLRSLCGLFINIHHDKVYFLHQTAREFLIQPSAPTTVSSDLHWHHSITTRHAHAVLAEVCMLYLDILNSPGPFKNHKKDQRKDLYDYSVSYWGHHFRRAEFERGSAMADLAMRVCTPDWARMSKWAIFISEEFNTLPARPRRWGEIRRGFPPVTTLLLASHYGIAFVAEALLTRRVDVNIGKEYRSSWTALIYSASGGHEDVTRLLLENGADIETKDKIGATALMQAARHGHEDVARLLLENGADAETKMKDGTTALMQAARNGHEHVTKLLLDHGAGVEAKEKDGMAALMRSVLGRHEPVTKLLLDHGAGVEAKEEDGTTALMRAARAGHEPITKLLLDHGADVKAKDNEGWTALMQAARRGHEDVTRLLLENGADVETREKHGITALILAAGAGHEPVTKLLLDHGAGVEAKEEDGKTALMRAVLGCHEPVTKLLLDHGADIETKDKIGMTALMKAILKGYETITKLLLDYGADIETKDEHDSTALMYAAAFGREAVTRLLLEHGADVEAKDKIGMTALMKAVLKGEVPATKLLLDHGADVEARKEDGMTALMIAVFRGEVPVTKLLLDHGADIETKDERGMTALMHAARAGHEPVSKLLLDYGADVEAKDESDMTALMIAVFRGEVPVTKLLLDHGADIETKDERGMTALMHAARNGHEHVTKLLLDHGAGVEAKEEDGMTALMRAVLGCHEPVTKLLLDHGADIETKDERGITALILAAGAGHEPITKLLLDHGADVKAKDNEGWTALRHIPITALLKEDERPETWLLTPEADYGSVRQLLEEADLQAE